MWSAVLWLSLSAVAAESFTVGTLDGKTLQGELRVLSADGLTVATADGDVTIPMVNLGSVRTQKVDAPARPEVKVQLADGSLLYGSQVQLDSGKATITGLDGPEIVVPRRSLRWIRWYQASTADAPWEETIAMPAAGDLLIIRKTAAASGSKVHLDPLEGLVSRVTKAGVAFEFDGDPINVKPDKVEGIVFYRPAVPASDPVRCKVTSPSWGELLASDVKLTGAELEVRTPSGALVSVPLSRGTNLDFRVGNMRWLADLEPDEVKTSFHLQPGGMKTKFADLFAPRSEGPFGGTGLQLGKLPKFESGLALHSPTTMTWRVPEGFSLFRATVGLPDDAAAGAKLRLRVLSDQQVLFDEEFSSAGAREPVQLECKVAGLKRVTIAVDSGERLDFGDNIILGDARFVK